MPRFRAILALACLVVIVLPQAGCAGRLAAIRFDRARYPISLSTQVPAADDAPITYPRLERLGTFKASGRGWSLLYTLIPLNELDFSDELNQQVQAAGGEAVVDLQLSVHDSGWNWFWPLTWIPIYPGNVPVELEGAIVRDGGARAPAE